MSSLDFLNNFDFGANNVWSQTIRANMTVNFFFIDFQK